jgi:hypothetical protein
METKDIKDAIKAIDDIGKMKGYEIGIEDIQKFYKHHVPTIRKCLNFILALRGTP